MFLDVLKDFTLDRVVTVSTKGGSTYSGAVSESDDDEICLAYRHNGALRYAHVLLSDVSSYVDHRNQDGSPAYNLNI